MKHLTLILTLFFTTLMFASPAHADWVKVGVNDTGTIYVDLDRMRIKGGYVYYWELQDFRFPVGTDGGGEGFLSTEVFIQGDCELFRVRKLMRTSYQKQMGMGEVDDISFADPEWQSVTETRYKHNISLTQTCRRAGIEKTTKYKPVLAKGVKVSRSYDDGLYYEEFTSNLANGVYESSYESGRLSNRTNYKDGKIEGLQELFYSRIGPLQLRRRHTVKDGETEGLLEMFYLNGQLRSRGTYKDGILDGPAEYYKMDGTLNKSCY
jgi:hypothetical protein